MDENKKTELKFNEPVIDVDTVSGEKQYVITNTFRKNEELRFFCEKKAERCYNTIKNISTIDEYDKIVDDISNQRIKF